MRFRWEVILKYYKKILFFLLALSDRCLAVCLELVSVSLTCLLMNFHQIDYRVGDFYIKLKKNVRASQTRSYGKRFVGKQLFFYLHPHALAEHTVILHISLYVTDSRGCNGRFWQFPLQCGGSTLIMHGHLAAPSFTWPCHPFINYTTTWCRQIYRFTATSPTRLYHYCCRTVYLTWLRMAVRVSWEVSLTIDIHLWLVSHRGGQEHSIFLRTSECGIFDLQAVLGGLDL